MLPPHLPFQAFPLEGRPYTTLTAPTAVRKHSANRCEIYWNTFGSAGILPVDETAIQ